MRRHLWLGLAIIGLTLVTTVQAQQRGRAGGGSRTNTNINVGGGGVGGGVVPYWGGFGGGMTAAMGEGIGMASVIQAAGQARLMDSIAAGNYEDARSKLIDNRLKWTNTYFEMRQQNTAFRRSLQAPPLSYEAAVRIAREKAPTRPTNSQLDAVTGAIVWPIVLQDPIFADLRGQLEAAFAERAESSGSISFATFQKIDTVCGEMLTKLQENLTSFPPQEYTVARNFVTGLRFEARFPEQ
jgi:hypothetical protein